MHWLLNRCRLCAADLFETRFTYSDSFLSTYCGSTDCCADPGRDAHRQFVPMQRALARAVALNEYVEHTGSALFACPPGLGPDDDWGSQLFS